MTEQEVKDLLALPGKVVIRPFGWVVQAGGHMPKMVMFESGVQFQGTILEGILLRARYRGPKTIRKGTVGLEVPASFSCAIFSENDRIAALDTNPGQRHANNVGEGHPYFGQTLTGDTHRHIWVGEYGYAEPVDPPMLDVVQLLTTFALECNLIFKGQIGDPEKGTQRELF